MLGGVAKKIAIHSWIYGLTIGLITPLAPSIHCPPEWPFLESSLADYGCGRINDLFKIPEVH